MKKYLELKDSGNKSNLTMKQFNNVKGFSLIEVAIAIALLALGLGGVAAVFSQGARAARKTQQQAAAYSLVRAVMEQYSDWNTLDRLDSAPPPCTLNTNVANTPAGNPYGPLNPPTTCTAFPFAAILLNDITYTPQLAISDGPINPAQLKRLEVTISWMDGTTPRNVTITTLKADY